MCAGEVEVAEEEVKTGSLDGAPPHICPVLRRSHFLLPSLILLRRGCNLAWNVPGSSFPFPDSWSKLLAAWLWGGARRWFDSHVTLSAWQTSASKWRRIYPRTDAERIFIYTRVQMYSQIGSSAHKVTHVRAEGFSHTRFLSLIYIGGLLRFAPR